MTKCKSCGAEIIWIKTPAGRSMPCDPSVKYFRHNKGGKEVFVRSDGVVVRGVRCSFDKSTGTGHVPHWATCKNAGNFRRPERDLQIKNEAIQQTMIFGGE